MSSHQHFPPPPSAASTETAREFFKRESVKPHVQPQPLPFSAGFWDSDVRTTAIRRAFVVALAQGTILTAVVILAVLAIYWGAFWNIKANVHHLNGWVVDFDGREIGQAVQSAAFNATGPGYRMTWNIMPVSQFSNGPSDVIQAVLDEKCWAAIVVHSNASTSLEAAALTADASYDGARSATIYTEEARNENVYSLLVSPQSRDIMTAAATAFATQHARQLASNKNIVTLLSAAPQVVTQPLYFTLDNLHPFDVTAANAADFVGLIYLLIIAFLLTNMHLGARLQSGLERHLRLSSLIGVRLITPIIMYFFLTLVFCLLSLAFLIPFNRRFAGGFVIYWMMCWLAMCALGLALEAVLTLMTPKFTPYFMILWIIGNVAVSFFPLELLPGVFRYGYAAPFYNVSRTVRTIIFSTRNQIGLNFGVQFAWVGVSLLTIPLIQWYRRRGVIREWWASEAPGKATG